MSAPHPGKSSYLDLQNRKRESGGLQCTLIERWSIVSFQALKYKVSTHLIKEFTGTHGIIEFDEVLFENANMKASLTIYNHRLLWAEFETSVDDK